MKETTNGETVASSSSTPIRQLKARLLLSYFCVFFFSSGLAIPYLSKMKIRLNNHCWSVDFCFLFKQNYYGKARKIQKKNINYKCYVPDEPGPDSQPVSVFWSNLEL